MVNRRPQVELPAEAATYVEANPDLVVAAAREDTQRRRDDLARFRESGRRRGLAPTEAQRERSRARLAGTLARSR